GALESFATAGSWAPICLELVGEVLERALRLDLAETVVQVDRWDIERLAGCRECVGARRARLDAMNRSAHVAPRIRCSHCAGGATCGPL
ncbi:MAG: hypothetical protein QGG89_10170, partial [Vicinamibacterales bacterium]|nr:hypothetical protein [Vicinamibacterales bacterium]